MDASIRINEDLLMNFYLFSAAKKAVYEDFCPYHYVVRSGSATRRGLTPQKIDDPIRVKAIILEVASQDVQMQAQRAYLSTCVNVYNALAVVKGEHADDRKKVRRCILEHRAWCALLSRKQRLLAGLIIHMPWAYGMIYGVYDRWFAKRIYD